MGGIDLLHTDEVLERIGNGVIFRHSFVLANYLLHKVYLSSGSRSENPFKAIPICDLVLHPTVNSGVCSVF